MPPIRKIPIYVFLTFGVLVFLSVGAGAKIPKASKKEAAFFKAIRSNDIHKVDALLRAGVSANAKQSGETALMMACERPEITRLLLDAGADPNVQGYEMQTALEYAARMRQPKVIKMLLDAHADPNLRDNFGSTALLSAGDTASISLLLHAGANAKDRDQNGKDALISESEGNWGDGTVELLLRSGVSANSQDNYGKTALMNFSHFKSAKEVSAILNTEANPNVGDSEQKTALMFAVEESTRYSDEEYYLDDTTETRNMEAVAGLLLKAGANINAKDKYGNTVLFLCERPSVTSILLNAGANVNAEDQDKRTPLMFAKNSEVARILLAAGANINAKDDLGRPVLMFGRDDTSLIAFLIHSGADVNLSSNDGTTVLMDAVEFTPEAVPLFLKAHADVNAKDSKGHTALAEAKRILRISEEDITLRGEKKKYIKVLKLLSEYGAKE